MRSAGVLLHISSLPGKYGIGTLGKDAYDFVDFLKEANQKIWQILPIGPTSYGDCPYSSNSSFAFNPYLIDLELLVKDKLLTKEEIGEPFESSFVNYNYVYDTKINLLSKAYERFNKDDKDFIKFKEEEAYWLDDYAKYSVLKKEHEGKPWYEWYDDFKYRNFNTMEWVNSQFWYKIDENKFIQYIFYKQFMKLKKYANKNGIKIMGDMPIYCAYDSADVWANPNYFELDPYLRPINVSGCPPDFFSPLGQLWGNPLYRWDRMKENKYDYWVKRVKHSFKMFDYLRIDHFRGFAGYYSIPYGSTNAVNGVWKKGPGIALFKEIEKNVKNPEIVAENLGFLTKDVFKLLKDTKYPGMNIFQFELGYKKSIPLKKGYPENNCFYTGTHDNMTIMSYYNSINDRDKRIINELCNISFYDRPNLKIIEFSMMQNSKICIVPLQDYLGLDDRYRMNIPGVALGNWKYISKKSDFSEDLKEFMKNLVIKSNR